MANRLSYTQLALLRAVEAGQILWRFDLRRGWAIRRRDVRPGAPGDALGSQVTTAVRRLANRGVVDIAEPPGRDDTPIVLTDFGRAVLDLANLDRIARDAAAATPCLPMAHDGREPFRAST